jgi:hypothetical protein
MRVLKETNVHVDGRATLKRTLTVVRACGLASSGPGGHWVP